MNTSTKMKLFLRHPFIHQSNRPVRQRGSLPQKFQGFKSYPSKKLLLIDCCERLLILLEDRGEMLPSWRPQLKLFKWKVLEEKRSSTLQRAVRPYLVSNAGRHLHFLSVLLLRINSFRTDCRFQRRKTWIVPLALE